MNVAAGFVDAVGDKPKESAGLPRNTTIPGLKHPCSEFRRTRNVRNDGVSMEKPRKVQVDESSDLEIANGAGCDKSKYEMGEPTLKTRRTKSSLERGKKIAIKTDALFRNTPKLEIQARITARIANKPP